MAECEMVRKKKLIVDFKNLIKINVFVSLRKLPKLKLILDKGIKIIV